MSHRNWEIRIQDILEAIEKIEKYIHGMDFDQFCEDDKTIDAVVRNIEVIGEAASKIPESVQNKNDSIPWRIMKDFRNKVAHEYFGVDNKILWATIHNNLLPLKEKIKMVKLD